MNRVLRPEWTHVRVVLQRAHDLGDLPDVAQIVECPLIQQFGYANCSQFRVLRVPLPGAFRKSFQEFYVVFALFLEVVERVLRIASR